MKIQTAFDSSLNISIEDKFILIELNVEHSTLPEGIELENVVKTFGSFASSYQIILDFRSVKYITYDLIDFVNLFAEHGAILLVDEGDYEFVQAKTSLKIKVFPTKLSHSPFKYSPIDTFFFRPFGINDHDQNMTIPERLKKEHAMQDTVGDHMPTEEEWKLVEPYDYQEGRLIPYPEYIDQFKEFGPWNPMFSSKETEILLRRRYVEHSIKSLGHNSLLTEFSFSLNSSNISLVPYHQHAAHQIDTKDGVLVGKPAVIASKTISNLKSEIDKFNELLNGHNVKENEIQRFLEKHPNMLKSLGYKNIYPKVVLHRDDGTYLEPDFILEPYGDRWCDILDLKLPNMKIIVGTRDRKKWSAAISELIAQLREYGSYFENEKYAKRVEDVFGIKCYRPKLIGVAGTQPSILDERQERRVMTQYSDVNIISFERLIEIAQSRILI